MSLVPSLTPVSSNSLEVNFQASIDETPLDTRSVAEKIANCVQLAKNELSKIGREKATIRLEGKMFFQKCSLRPSKLVEIMEIFQNTSQDPATRKLVTNEHRTLISELILKAVHRYANECDMSRIIYTKALERFKNCIDAQESAEKKLTSSKALPRNERKQFSDIAEEKSRDTNLARNNFTVVEFDKNVFEASIRHLNTVIKTQTWLVIPI